MPQGGADIQAGVFVLPDHDLCAVLHVGDRFLGELLARPERHPRESVARRHHAAHHVDADVGHQRSAAAGLIHEGHRRLDGGE